MWKKEIITLGQRQEESHGTAAVGAVYDAHLALALRKLRGHRPCLQRPLWCGFALLSCEIRHRLESRQLKKALRQLVDSVF